MSTTRQIHLVSDEALRQSLRDAKASIDNGAALAVVEVATPIDTCDAVFWLIRNRQTFIMASAMRKHVSVVGAAVRAKAPGSVCLMLISEEPPPWFDLFEVHKVSHATCGTS